MPEDVTEYFSSTKKSHHRNSEYEALDTSSYQKSAYSRQKHETNVRTIPVGSSSAVSTHICEDEMGFEDTESQENETEEEEEDPFKDEPFFKRIYHKYLIVDKSIADVSILDSFMYNSDLRPVEERRRAWSWFNYCYFWLAECFNINTWQIAATGLQLGLNWWQCWITIWIGYTFVGIFVCLASRAGSSYHISFPITTRASFGIFFSLWPIINRIVMAIVWYAVQSWLGVEPVSLMLRSIFGNDLPDRIPNHFGSPNSTTYQFMCFMIFWACELPFLWVPPHKVRHLFTVKAVLVPFGAFGFLIWSIKKAHNKIALGSLTDTQLTGTAFSWAFLRSLMGCMANFSTLTLNAPDFSRFAKTKNAALYSQLICIPFLFSITCLIGILVTAAGYEMYGINYWSPVEVLEQYLIRSYTKGTRAGVFLISFVFAVAQLGANISANSLSCGTDLTAILPKFLNIRRGSIFCACMALCICPWNMMSTSSKFTMALSAYAIFLSSIAGVICSDYFVVRRGYLKLTHLYSNRKGSFYMYGNKYGINWRALVAYLCGVAPNLPGFIGDVGAPKITVSIGAMRVYYLSYWVGYAISFLAYTILCYLFPVPGQPVKNILKDKGWFQIWADVENFEEEWLETLEKEDLYDDVVSVDVHDSDEKKYFY
ncbi:uracil permease KNAG_0K01560 [Huiozyma naganishii CBS 8797]|uniref:Uracil permease n=1 Tax=Huiozyma naganishii (strain ATCC MYA-139 / BCRC 22969 / CBS 8797 / KCTC 17520 / NBRC 10181 / NCYC 3082 / Yp74L-3) TaxID=1071383 RepID=J7S3C4_HUIN7|nr:hypothetical protein KNAG_0K01560 [Kazachstania naganishii CBS 8797]CCK72517.1 hypothetical protein KNAG_0K01560 [Kazachstania naganishii CBS 8797]